MDLVLSKLSSLDLTIRALFSQMWLEIALPTMMSIIYSELTNWKRFGSKIFSQSGCGDPDGRPVLLTEPAMISKNVSTSLAVAMFETFNVSSCYIANQGVLSIYASGRNTGIAVDIGESNSQFIPVYESFSIPHASLRNNIGGIDIDISLLKVFDNASVPGANFTSLSKKMEIVRTFKEKSCYVALDFDAELQNPNDSHYHHLSDGNSLDFGKDTFKAPEILFQPGLDRKEFEGIGQNIFSCIDKYYSAIHKYLFNNIVLSGGSTMFNGFPERVEKEITKLAPSSTNIRVIAEPERKYGVWFGGSVFASRATFPQMLVSREEYNDAGPPIILRKCL